LRAAGEEKMTSYEALMPANRFGRVPSKGGQTPVAEKRALEWSKAEH